MISFGDRYVGREERVTDYLLPVKIVATFGEVKSPENLLKNADMQIQLVENCTALFTNSVGKPHAAVLLDFGRELTGGVRILNFWAKNKDRHPEMLLRFGESAKEAVTPSAVNVTAFDHSAREMVITTPLLSDAVFGSTGFRFVYLELLGDESEIALKRIVAAFTYRDLPYLGTFRSSDPLLDRIFEVSAYTVHLCMQSALWDGVKRDRLIWIGDSNPEMKTVFTVFGNQKILRESLASVRAITPLPGWMNGFPAYSMWWILDLFDDYLYTGDASFLRSEKDYLAGLTRQICDAVTRDGDLVLNQYFLDWPTCDTPAAKPGVAALAARALDAANELLALVGEKEIAESAAVAAAKIRKAGGTPHGAKQTAAMLYLGGMAKAKDVSPLLLEGGTRGLSTFMAYYVLKTVTETSSEKNALDMLRSYFGGMLKMGATTFWEDFSEDWLPGSCPIDRLPEEGERDIHSSFGAFCYKGLRHSLCHGWASGAAPFLTECILGIEIAAPGCKVLKIAPKLGDLAFAEGSFPLPTGEVVKVRVDRNPDGTVAVKVDAPRWVKTDVVL